MVKIIISVDDFSPVPGYGLLLNNGPLKFLEDLNKEFGAKFTLFAIPIKDAKEENDWRKHENWVKQVKKLDYIEIAQHGLFHKSEDPRFGAQELIGLNPEEAMKRIKLGKAILESAGFEVKGFKAPGWGYEPYLLDLLKELKFEYIADHFVGNKPIEVEGIYRIPLTFTINQMYHDKYDDYIILHSHISPQEGNMNGWSKDLYKVVSDYLKHIRKKYDTLEFLTMSEYLAEVKK